MITVFEIYNGLLRAYGNEESRGIVPSHALVGAGQDVRGRFTTTLHVLNSGVLKLAKLQPATEVYRGISRMKLPKSFTEKNELNVRCEQVLLLHLFAHGCGQRGILLLLFAALD